MGNKIKEAFAMVKRDTTALHSMVSNLTKSLNEVMEKQKKMEHDLCRLMGCKCEDKKTQSVKGKSKNNSKKKR